MPFLLSQSRASVHAFCLSSALQSHQLDRSSFLQPSKKKCRGIFHRKSYLRKIKTLNLKKKKLPERFSERTFLKRLFETSLVFFLLFKTAAQFCSFQRRVHIKFYFHSVYMIHCVCVCLRTSSVPIYEHIASSNNQLWISMMVITSAELLSWVQ